MLSDQLIPIDQIAKQSGTDKIHLAYLTKLRLIPQTVRRKIGNKITGCYPHFVISQIQKIEDLKNKGLTYSQIRFELNNKAINTVSPVIETGSLPTTSHTTPMQNPLVYLIIGLILGYVLFSLNSINNALSTKSNQATVAANTIPAETDTQKIIRLNSNDNTSSDSGSVYLIAVPNKNLYKLGQMDLNSLVN